MITGTTSNGFAYSVDPAFMEDMELVDALAEMDRNQLAVSVVVLKILGKEQRAALYEHLRDDSGRVPIKAVEAVIMEIFAAMGQPAKNS